ncbi:protein SAMBA [Telopea speciosissima]|uniref:protein SAMBA n=1 Tax=Telopea speciosissima TaxID=54955 RepID=UPI001CC790F7|nr:protein SAMBA [Telopea speciosissima]XP_043694721.1 protein SAMBA [Telopea speciosissima]
MSSSSPAHSSVSAATSAGGGGGQGGSSSNAALASDDNSSFHFPSDLISAQDRKEEALLVLKNDLMSALNKEVKSIDEDNWKFAGPRSQIHLISRPGAFLHKQTETAKQLNLAQRK